MRDFIFALICFIPFASASILGSGNGGLQTVEGGNVSELSVDDIFGTTFNYSVGVIRSNLTSNDVFVSANGYQNGVGALNFVTDYPERSAEDGGMCFFGKDYNNSMCMYQNPNYGGRGLYYWSFANGSTGSDSTSDYVDAFMFSYRGINMENLTAIRKASAISIGTADLYDWQDTTGYNLPAGYSGGTNYHYPFNIQSDNYRQEVTFTTLNSGGGYWKFPNTVYGRYGTNGKYNSAFDSEYNGRSIGGQEFEWYGNGGYPFTDNSWFQIMHYGDKSQWDIVTGTATSTQSGKLEDNTKNFTAMSGYLNHYMNVYLSTGGSYNVSMLGWTPVYNETTLNLYYSGIPVTAGQTYKLYIPIQNVGTAFRSRIGKKNNATQTYGITFGVVPDNCLGVTTCGTYTYVTGGLKLQSDVVGETDQNYPITRTIFDKYGSYYVYGDSNQAIFIDDKSSVGSTYEWKLDADTDSNWNVQYYNGGYKDLFVVNKNGLVGINGTPSGIAGLEVYSNVSNLSIYAHGNISATGYITHTSIYDKDKAKDLGKDTALDFAVSSEELKTAGEIDDSKFLYSRILESTATITGYQKVNRTVKVCKQESTCTDKDLAIDDKIVPFEEYKTKSLTTYKDYKPANNEPFYIDDVEMIQIVRPPSCNYENSKVEVCKNETVLRDEPVYSYGSQYAVSIDDELALHKEQIYELKIQTQELYSALCEIDNTLEVCK